MRGAKHTDVAIFNGGFPLRRRYEPLASNVDLLRQKKDTYSVSFLGAEDEIRTRATVSHTTPLAGEPLEPLGYFCMARLHYGFFKAIII